MAQTSNNQNPIGSRVSKLSDLQWLVVIAGIRFVIHLFTNHQYGFHQDALAFIANGLRLDWGYVAYPPVTPFIGRIGYELFGLSLVGIKAFGALAQCVAMVVTGLMAKELGGGRLAQTVASIGAGIGVMSLLMGTLFQYITFDYLWWVLLLYGMIRLLKTENPRWWVVIGLCLGLGVMTKYTVVFLVASLVMTVLLTQLRQHLFSRWLWAGALLSFVIVLPNLVWQVQHDFISLDFLTFISARDRALGRADGFFSQQLYVNVNPFVLPLAIWGLYFYLSEAGRRYRPLGYIFVLTLLLFAVAQGRFYYSAPLYPMLLAAGAVQGEKWLAGRSQKQKKRALGVTGGFLFVGAVIGIVLALPIAPLNSGLWDVTSGVHGNFIDQLGWEALAETTADIYERERSAYSSLGILTANHGLTGAFELYGTANGLPSPISPANTHWLHGYGDPPPEAVLAVGFELETLSDFFAECREVGVFDNMYRSFTIYLCRDLKGEWEEIWPMVQSFS